MTTLSTSDKIYTSKSKKPDYTRGVFAKRTIKKGECIEICPIIEIPPYDTTSTEGSMLVMYFYFFGKKKDKPVLPMGFGALYNHLDTPNAYYKENLRKHIISFYALRNIEKDEEITVSYRQINPKDKTPLWFE